MKICMITYSFYEMDPRVRRDSECLVNRGDAVDVICLRGEGREKHDRLSGVNVYRIQRRQGNEKHPIGYLKRLLYFFFLSAFTVTRLFLKKRYNLIQVRSYPDFEVFATFIPKLFGAMVVLNIHELVPEFYARKFGLHANHVVVRFLKWVEKISCRFVDHVITISDIWKNTLVRRSVPESKCTVVLTVPDPRVFKPIEYKDRSEIFTLMCFGKLTEYYGLDIAIKAIDIIRREVPSVKLEINAYDGPQRDALLKLIANLKLEKFVRFNITKLLPLDEYSELMRRADIGIDPRRGGVFAGEYLSSVVMNFFTTRIPVVVSRTKAYKIYFDESMVMFFEPDDYHDLARCIVELSNNPKERQELVKNADGFIKDHSWERYKKIYYELADDLCKS